MTDSTIKLDDLLASHQTKVEAHRKSGKALRESASDLGALLRMGLIPDSHKDRVHAALPKTRVKGDD